MGIDIGANRAVVIQNKGNLLPQVLKNTQTILEEDLPHDQAAIKEIKMPVEHTVMIKVYERSMLTEEVSPELLEFEEKCAEFYNEAARNEGYLDKGEGLEWRFVHIRKSNWLKICEEEGIDQSNGITMGRSDYLTNMITVIYPDDEPTETELFQMKLVDFHEARHRVGGKITWVNVEVSAGGEPEKIQMVHAPMAEKMTHVEWEKGGVPVIEELFTVAYVMDNIDKIDDPKLKKVKEEREWQMQSEGLDPDFVTLELGASYHENNFAGNYHLFLDIYRRIKSEIPNFLELMEDARTGKSGTVNKLAREIVDKYDKRALMALHYVSGTTVKSLASLFEWFQIKKEGANTYDPTIIDERINVDLAEILFGIYEKGSLSEANKKLFDKLIEPNADNH